MARTIVSFVAPTRGGDATAWEGARGGEGRARGEIGVDEKIFSARSPFPPCLAEIALKSSRPIVHEQRIWYNACVLPKWEDHREAEKSLRVGGGKRFPPPSLFRRLRL